jgi:AAA+ ATPase superfamily predicted ATPase
MHKELVHAIREVSGTADTQVGGYLKILVEKFELIERKLPVFAKPEAKRGRYYVTDNFLRSWLAAIGNPVSAIAFRPLDELIHETDKRLMDVEGGSLEKLVGQLYEERSRKGIGDFPITHRVQGFWDKAGTEIDLVAFNETTESIRFGSIKRSPKKLMSDVNNFIQHVDRFLKAMPQYHGWSKQLVGIAPTLDTEQRTFLKTHGILPQDLNDLTAGM